MPTCDPLMAGPVLRIEHTVSAHRMDKQTCAPGASLASPDKHTQKAMWSDKSADTGTYRLVRLCMLRTRSVRPMMLAGAVSASRHSFRLFFTRRHWDIQIYTAAVETQASLIHFRLLNTDDLSLVAASAQTSSASGLCYAPSVTADDPLITGGVWITHAVLTFIAVS